MLIVLVDVSPGASPMVPPSSSWLFQGLMTLHPFHSDRLILNPSGLAGVLTALHLCMDMEHTILDKHHYLLYYVTPAMSPRMLMTVGAQAAARAGGRRGFDGDCLGVFVEVNV